jgi:hypothetical protein
MFQIVTIRQQILAVLQRVYDSMGFNDPFPADRIEKELMAEFSATAVATTPSADFDVLAKEMGYVRLQPGQVVVDGGAIADHCAACDEEGMTVVCDGCVLKPIRDRIKEARDE